MTPAARAADFTPIYVIQGATDRSPLAGQTVDTLGVVTGVTADGFYLQDPVGDGSPATSDGLFIYTYRRPAVTAGACVAVRGAQVEEFYGKTELNRAEQYGLADGCAMQAVAPATLTTVLPGQSPVAVLEPWEGMLMQLPALDALVVGPTKRFADGEREIAVLPAALRPYLGSAIIDQTDTAGQAALIFLSNQLGATLPAADRGDRVTAAALVGVLDYNFGKYQFLPLADAALSIEKAALAAPAVLPEQPGDISVCSFNVHGLGRGLAQYPDADDYAAALAARAATIAGPLQGCTIVALQETSTPADAAALAAVLADAHGLSYTAAALEGPASSEGEFPLTNSLLVRGDRAQVLALDQVTGCATRDVGLIAPGTCPAGQYPIFDRPPLIAEVVIDPGASAAQRLWIVNNHWKSKAGDEEANAKLRGEQAAAVARAVQALLDAEPDARVVVLGDLNDFYGGPAVALLADSVAPLLAQPLDWLTPLDRYTYIFNGATQVLDHLLLTPNLAMQVAAVQIVHVNADFAADAAARDPGYAVSDHDPIRVLLRPGGAAGVGGHLGVAGVTVTARDTTGATVRAVSDANGDFRLWGLAPGAVTLVYAPLATATLDATQQSVTLAAGFTLTTSPTARHRTPAAAAWLALSGPDLVNRLLGELPAR